MTNEEMVIFMTKAQSDIAYIRQRIDEKFAAYDKVMDKNESLGDRVTKIEGSLLWKMALCGFVGGLIGSGTPGAVGALIKYVIGH